MGHAGVKKREKNKFQQFISNATPWVSKALSYLGSSPIVKGLVDYIGPRGSSFLFSQGMDNASKMVDSTGRFISGDIDSSQWGKEMYNTYVLQGIPQKVKGFIDNLFGKK